MLTTTPILFAALAYSIISPIINGLSVATFFLLYQLWKYLFLWQLDTDPATETGGQYFPKAMQHIFVGLYIQQICLAALFFLARDQTGAASAVPEGALMIVLIAFTAFFHVIINNSYGPLIKFLPLTLADMTYAKDDGNVKAAALELDDQASCKDVKADAEADATATGTARASDEKARKRFSGASASGSATGSIDGDGKPTFKATAADADADIEAGSPSSPSADTDADADAVRGVDEEAGPKDVYHPASVEAQPVVWLPRDPLGLGEAEERACREAGVEVSTRDAVMDAKGHVDIAGPPPGEERE